MAYAMTALAAVQAGGSAPTPIYHLYQSTWRLSPTEITIVFALYPLSLLVSLLTVGSLSDHVGRRPVILAAMLLSACSMSTFLAAQGFGSLIAARILQGLATGAAASSLGAALLDVRPARGALINSATAFLGTTVGALVSSALVSYAPAPARLVYALLLVVFIALAAAVRRMPETSTPRSGERFSLRPHLELPTHVRPSFWMVSPVNIAGWSLGGFYLSLMPALFRSTTGITTPILGGSVVALLTFAGAAAILALDRVHARTILIFGSISLAAGTCVTIAGVHGSQVLPLTVGTLIAGIGFGASFFGAARTVLPLARLHERAGVLSAFYVESYLAFSLPAVLISLLEPRVGLSGCAYLYGAFVTLLALASLIATLIGGAGRNGGKHQQQG